MGPVAASSWLRGRLAPRAKAEISPSSRVRSTTLLSNSPMGIADSTIPVTIKL